MKKYLILLLCCSCMQQLENKGIIRSINNNTYSVEFKDQGKGGIITLYFKTDRPDTVKVNQILTLKP